MRPGPIAGAPPDAARPIGHPWTPRRGSIFLLRPPWRSCSGTQRATTPLNPIKNQRWSLDAHILDGRRDRHFNNDKSGRRALRNWLLKSGVNRAVFEPTGRYHRNLHECLADAGLETVLVNPLRSRRFAEAIGTLAKNDRVDAAMLASFGLLAVSVRAGRERRLGN